MADKKISALTASTTPLAGTEVLPIVQSSTTKQVSVANLTAGRAVATGALTTTGAISATTSITSGNGLVASGATYPGSGTSAELGYGGTSVYLRGYDRTGAAYKSVVINEGLTIAGGSAGDVTLAANNLVIGTSGKGIDFSATSHPAGMTSELLADYEEGTWTPTLGGTATYLAQTGSYTKVGRLVFVRGTLYINAIGTGTTNSLSGLPFTAADAPPITVQIGGSAQAFSAVYGYIGTTNVYITYNAALAVSNQTAANVFTALTYIDFSGCYSV